jgi:hypothetical protein
MTTESTTLPVLANELNALGPLNIDDDTACTDMSVLSATEKKMLEHHETIIEQGVRSIVEVGSSLLAIQRGRLYRSEFKSFNAYCRDKWGFGRQRGTELINAAITSEELHANGVQIDTLNERQLRPLAGLANADQRVPALTRAQELAGAAKMTSRHVQEAVDELKGVKKPVVIDVESITATKKGSATITLATPQTTSIEDVRVAIDVIRDLALSLKVQDRFIEPLERLEAMIEHLLSDKHEKN